MDWKEEYKKRLVSLETAAGKITSGDFVGIGLGMGACSPDFFHALLWTDGRIFTTLSSPIRSRFARPGYMMSI